MEELDAAMQHFMEADPRPRYTMEFRRITPQRPARELEWWESEFDYNEHVGRQQEPGWRRCLSFPYHAYDEVEQGEQHRGCCQGDMQEKNDAEGNTSLAEDSETEGEREEEEEGSEAVAEDSQMEGEEEDKERSETE